MNREEIDKRFHRQLDMIHPDQLAFPITIIGAGASGSHAALALAKMGCQNLTVYDDDQVTEHNLPNQVYGLKYLGEPKTEALWDVILMSIGWMIETKNERFGEQPLGEVVLSCVDNMEARKLIWEQAKDQGSRAKPITVIDPRQGGEFIVVYTAKSHGDVVGAQAYEQSLHPSGESMALPCTARAVIYNSMLTGGIVAALVKKHALGERLPRKIMMDCSQLAFGKED